MAIYHYRNSPLIDRIEMQTPHPGITTATIITAPGVDIKHLQALREHLSGNGISTLMDTVDGHTAIQVRGIRDENALLTCLNKLGLANGSVEKELTAADKNAPKESFGDKVRGKSLFLSALFYDLGNISYIMSGIRRGQHNENGKFTSNDIAELLVGAAFGIGDAVMTGYGKDRGDEELHAVANGLKRHLHRKGIVVPGGDELNPENLHQNGVFKAVDRWLRNISCMSNA